MTKTEQYNIILDTIRARDEQDLFCDERRIFLALSKVDDDASLAKTQRLIRELQGAGKVVRQRRWGNTPKGMRIVAIAGTETAKLV